MTIKAKSVTWIGESGRRYPFELWPVGTRFNAVSGVYMFCAFDGEYFLSKYVGETDSFRARIDDGLGSHEGWQCARTAGATYIATLVVGGSRQQRLDIETDLRRRLKPPCNKQ